MITRFDTPADAEDAYYDAIDESDLEKMMSVWAEAPDTACLLPMLPLQQGRQAIRAMWRSMMEQSKGLEITVNHLQWIELGDVSIHLLEEVVTPAGAETQPPIYATNVYRRHDDGWHLLLHLNSPAPPPGRLPPLP